MANLREVLSEIWAAVLPLPERRRLAGRAVHAALYGAPSTGTAQEEGSTPTMLAECMAAVAQKVKSEQDLTITKAKSILRAVGPSGASLASRLSRLSKTRNATCHPDVSLLRDIGSLEFGEDASSMSPQCKPQQKNYNLGNQLVDPTLSGADTASTECPSDTDFDSKEDQRKKGKGTMKKVQEAEKAIQPEVNKSVKRQPDFVQPLVNVGKGLTPWHWASYAVLVREHTNISTTRPDFSKILARSGIVLSDNDYACFREGIDMQLAGCAG